MAITTTIKSNANRILRVFGLHLETLTAQKTEHARLQGIERMGHLDGPVYPLLCEMGDFDLDWVQKAMSRFSAGANSLMEGNHPQSAGFDPKNEFFNGSDAQLLYLIIRDFRPVRIVEIGSGNSTRVARAAVADSNLSVTHIAIDPNPRIDIDGLVDELHRCRLEELDFEDLDMLVDSLQPNDILFIDSSHELRVAGDLATIFCRMLPRLRSGVIVHFHDIFLPYEYPRDFVYAYPAWGEQYLLQIWLASASQDILWPGYLVQRARPSEFKAIGLAGDRAQSFWFQVAPTDNSIQ